MAFIVFESIDEMADHIKLFLERRPKAKFISADSEWGSTPVVHFICDEIRTTWEAPSSTIESSGYSQYFKSMRSRRGFIEQIRSEAKESIDESTDQG